MKENKNEDYFVFLDALRESGSTNMFAAAPYLVAEYPELKKTQARVILKEWMESFSDRHPK